MIGIRLLQSLGFRKIGVWSISGEGLALELDPKTRAARQSLYAFVAGNSVVYVGKSSGTFGGRMAGYKRPGKSQATNQRIAPLIRKLLLTKRSVSIYHFGSRKILTFKGVKLNLAAALEDELISRIRPKWNIHGHSRKKA